MKYLFEYNWSLRNRWIDWCNHLTVEDLFQERSGGHQSFIRNLFHIIDVEQRWYARLTGRKILRLDCNHYNSLELLSELSVSIVPEIRTFIDKEIYEEKEVTFETKDRQTTIICTHGEILRHMIAHEIHHIGQLSVWAREIGKEPVSANFIGQNLM
ncbi:damage-inducible protein DinB [Pontibacillus chungwhensis BH030062]|uniref:Damage-inducible protein DinB n=1 Tax=Pontibacillus chungwhensis BH030062 TaxID=1385513 RepID=A0A0A2UV04_9BACI|nr:DinB family protein [Pontibacillus chungwhensis]KGP90598.1 damage-inducible protein DinB [Pontibacillus chungwhensis BH030062]